MTACCRVFRRHCSAFGFAADMEDIARQTQNILVLRERGLMGGIIGIKETKP